MYQVLCDNHIIYDPRLEDRKIFNGKGNLEVNKSGSFSFLIYPSNPTFEYLRKLKSTIVVKQDDEIIFRGRILNDVDDFHNGSTITCEGELSFFCDTIVRPFLHLGSASSLLEKLIENHNSQVSEDRQFKIGNMTVTDVIYIPVDELKYPTTLDVIKEYIFEKAGGYIFFRHESDGTYVDYHEACSEVSNQTIEFGKNLLDFKKTTRGEDIATAILPLGNEVDGKKLTIESIVGQDYIQDDEAVEQFGFILKTMEFDVDTAEDLYSWALAWIMETVKLANSIELTAVDMSHLDKDISSFKLGSYVTVISKPHGVDQQMIVQKMSFNLHDASKNKLTLGVTYSTYLDEQIGQSSQVKNAITVVNQTTQTVGSMEERVSQAEADILEIKENGTGGSVDLTDYALKTELPTKTSQLVNDSGFLTEHQDLSDYAKKTDSVELTMTADGWSGSTYSFEATYPNSNYDIEIELDQSCSDEELEAWGNAIILGKIGENVATARGTVPTIDIPIIAKVVKK